MVLGWAVGGGGFGVLILRFAEFIFFACVWVDFGRFFVVVVVVILASWWLVVMGGCHCGIGLWLRRLW